jgi:hypothetical protein
MLNFVQLSFIDICWSLHSSLEPLHEISEQKIEMANTSGDP